MPPRIEKGDTLKGKFCRCVKKVQKTIKLRNKFIYLGNMRNFSPCKKEKETINGFASVLLDNTDNHLSWSTYKNNIKNNN